MPFPPPPPREDPTPRGYKKTLIPMHAMGQIYHFATLSCEKCGALVMYHRTHTDWHKKRGE